MDPETKATFAEHDRRLSRVEERQQRQREEVDALIDAVKHLAVRAGVHIAARPKRTPT